MSLRTLPRVQTGAYLGYLDDEGNPSQRAIADLLRTSLNRWGLSPKRGVLEYGRAELRACGVEDVSGVPRVLQRLVELSECDSLYVEHEPYLIPAAPRWIPVGRGAGVYLGAAEPPSDLLPVDSDHHDIVRRFRVGEEEGVATLAMAGVQEVSLAEWLVPPGFIRHASRRMRRPARSDRVSLGRFWEVLEKALTDEGLPLDRDAEVRILESRPGEYFGRHHSAEPGGRWTTEPDEGLWCAYRRGYGDTHWHPCIIAVGTDDRRVLNLYDDDEWRWAVLARGRSVGPEEIVQADGPRVQLTFPAPAQLRAAMEILGRSSGAWAWEVNPDGPDLWQLLD